MNRASHREAKLKNRSQRLTLCCSTVVIVGALLMVANLLLKGVIRRTVKRTEAYTNAPTKYTSDSAGLIKDVYRYAFSRGKYDCVHNLTDYRKTFARDNAMIEVYIGFNINVNGTQDKRSMPLLNRILHAPNDHIINETFIRAYNAGYEAASKPIQGMDKRHNVAAGLQTGYVGRPGIAVAAGAAGG